MSESRIKIDGFRFKVEPQQIRENEGNKDGAAIKKEDKPPGH
jgi:hypothetical protein